VRINDSEERREVEDTQDSELYIRQPQAEHYVTRFKRALFILGDGCYGPATLSGVTVGYEVQQLV
jgi:hypothetical protein